MFNICLRSSAKDGTEVGMKDDKADAEYTATIQIGPAAECGASRPFVK